MGAVRICLRRDKWGSDASRAPRTSTTGLTDSDRTRILSTSLSFTCGSSMKSELESLVVQMQDGGILYAEAVAEFKKAFIIAMLDRHNGNQCRAARALDVHRNTLSRAIAELRIQPRPPKRASDGRAVVRTRVA